MDFCTVKAVTIPEGAVTKIMSGMKLLWKKAAYKNLIETAMTTPGGTEIYNGTGYKDGYRWSSSSKSEKTDNQGRITGWMPFVSGATYRIKNFNGSQITGYCDGIYLVLYAAGTISTHEYVETAAEYDRETDTFTIARTSNATHFRISGFNGNNQPIITMNEEIPE